MGSDRVSPSRSAPRVSGRRADVHFKTPAGIDGQEKRKQKETGSDHFGNAVIRQKERLLRRLLLTVALLPGSRPKWLSKKKRRGKLTREEGRR